MQVVRKKYQVASIKYQEGCTKYNVQSTKYGIRVFGYCLHSKIEIRHSIFSIPYFVTRISYFVLSTWYFVLFPKLHTHRIDAIPDAALIRWTIRETMAQVTSTGRTKDLFSNHEVAVVHVHLYGLWLDWMGKARPSAAAVVLEVRVKNWVSTTFTGVNPCFFV